MHHGTCTFKHCCGRSSFDESVVILPAVSPSVAEFFARKQEVGHSHCSVPERREENPGVRSAAPQFFLG